MGYMFCLGACFSCGNDFSFNPDKVPSIRVSKDPVTGKWIANPQGSKEPVCRNCMQRANDVREKMGLPPHQIPEGAYEPGECV